MLIVAWVLGIYFVETLHGGLDNMFRKIANESPDFLIIGAGIVGLTVALQLKKQFPDSEIIIIEKEKKLGVHASGRNSGVLLAGFYYSANSLKAKLCRDGNYFWREYCLEKKLKMMGLAAYAEFYSEDKVALAALIEKH